MPDDGTLNLNRRNWDRYRRYCRRSNAHKRPTNTRYVHGKKFAYMLLLKGIAKKYGFEIVSAAEPDPLARSDLISPVPFTDNPDAIDSRIDLTKQNIARIYPLLGRADRVSIREFRAPRRIARDAI